jgi:hypothetical protein
VVAQHLVEQCFVAVLQGAQIDVFVETLPTSAEFAPAVLGLLFEGFLRGRQQAQQSVLAAFGVGECRALGRQRVEQKFLSCFLLCHSYTLSARGSRDDVVEHGETERRVVKSLN